MKGANDKAKKKARAPLREELRDLEKRGVELWLDGQPSTPKRICRACKVAEEGTYMRDYIRNQKGDVEHLEFNSVKNKT